MVPDCHLGWVGALFIGWFGGGRWGALNAWLSGWFVGGVFKYWRFILRFVKWWRLSVEGTLLLWFLVWCAH